MSPLRGSMLVEEFVLKMAFSGVGELIEFAREYFWMRNRVPIPEPAKPEDELSSQRAALQRKIRELQQIIVLKVYDPEFLARVLPLLLGYMSTSNTASNKQTLDLLDADVTGLSDAVAGHLQERRRQQALRRIAVVVSLGWIGIVAAFLYYCSVAGVPEDSRIVILGLPLTILLYSVIGSFAAIAYRFTIADELELKDPLRWLVMRPLTGIVMGAIAYLVARVGLLAIASGASPPDLGKQEIMWLVAFLAGFSDRYSDWVLTNLMGRLGTDTTSGLVMTPDPSDPKSAGTLGPVLDLLATKHTDFEVRTASAAGGAAHNVSLLPFGVAERSSTRAAESMSQPSDPSKVAEGAAPAPSATTAVGDDPVSPAVDSSKSAGHPADDGTSEAADAALLKSR